MTHGSAWTVSEFASVIGVSTNSLRNRIAVERCKLRRAGNTYVIDKGEFFTWYSLIGKGILDKAFPNTKIAHDEINRSMRDYVESDYYKRRCRTRIDPIG